MNVNIVNEHAHLDKRVINIGMGWCPLVLGECVQGATKEGLHFLITSPIGLFSWAEFTRLGEGESLSVDPPSRWKSLSAVRSYLTSENLPRSGILRVVTPLELGQGFGTSTADITASLRAVASAWNRKISPESIARIAIRIEPTDGSMFPGCVAFAHRTGSLLEMLGSLPEFEALVVCTGGIVDTLEFDRRRKDFRYCQKDQEDILRAWQMVRHANRVRDAALLAQATTVSARINEQLLHKPYFGEMMRFIELEGIDGLMVAHSGTVSAFIIDPTRSGFAHLIEKAKGFLSALDPPSWFQISNRVIVHGVGAYDTECNMLRGLTTTRSGSDI